MNIRLICDTFVKNLHVHVFTSVSACYYNMPRELLDFNTSFVLVTFPISFLATKFGNGNVFVCLCVYYSYS